MSERQATPDIGEIIGQLEPVAALCGRHVQSVGEAAQVSIAVTLKRIADVLEKATAETSSGDRFFDCRDGAQS